MFSARGIISQKNAFCNTISKLLRTPQKLPIQASTINANNNLHFFCQKKSRCTRKCGCSFSVSEVFAVAKVKLPCSEVRADARVKLSLPTLPKAKLHYPQDNFTYEVNFTCPYGQT